MAVDFNILARVPTIGSQIMAGQEAGRARAAQNMLLQQRQLEFQQAQEDRKLAMEERRMQREAAAAQVARRGQLAQVLRQSGMDPSDMQSATQFYAAALEANEPTAIAAAKDWLSLARETAQSRAAGAEYQGIMGGGAPAPAPAPMATPMVAAPAPMATPMTAPAVAPMAPEAPALDERGVNRAAWMAKAGLEEDIAPPPVNQLAPQAPAAPPVNQLAAAPAPAPAAAPTPAPAKDDAAALRAEAQRLEGAQQRLRQSPFEKNQKRAQELDKPIERLLKRADDIEKAAKPSREALSPLGRLLAEQSTLPENDPRRAAYAAAIEKESQRPDRETPLAQLIRERDALPLTDPRRPLYNDAIKKATTQPPPVEVKLPPQEGAFETGLGRGQSERILKDQEVAQDARSIIDTVQQGRQLLQSGMITGFGAEALTQIGAALNQAGISFASDSVANTQAFAANMAQNVGRIIKQFGAGTGLSNADREYAEKMAGGKITLDRAAIERILDINERAARNVITAHNKRVAGIKTNVPLTVELPPAMPTAPAAAPAGRPSLQQIFQQPAGR